MSLENQREQFQQMLKAQADENIQTFTFLGNITNWRPMVNNTRRSKILVGHAKIMNLLARLRTN